jgi:hypothetical protein
MHKGLMILKWELRKKNMWIRQLDLANRPYSLILRYFANSNNTLIYIQQDATLCSLFYLQTALNVSDGTTIHHQERKQLYLQHLVLVRPLLLPAAITV